MAGIEIKLTICWSMGNGGDPFGMSRRGEELTLECDNQDTKEVWWSRYRRSVMIKIPKKGSLSDCNNWRGITLLSVPSKIFCKVIIQCITQAVDDLLRNEQSGIRKGRGCTDNIFTLRNILEQYTEWNSELYINFIVYEKAFDSIHRDSLW